MTDWPRTGCSVIVRNGDRVLLVKRGKAPFKGYWSLPGGSQEAGETLEECALRELEEETALKAIAVRFALVRDRIGRDTQGHLTHHFVLATFIAELFEGEASAGDDAEAIGWYTLAEMQGLKTTPQTPELIAQLLAEA